jgi:hypothetical protein
LFFKGNLHGLKAWDSEPQAGARGSGGGSGVGGFRAPRWGVVGLEGKNHDRIVPQSVAIFQMMEGHRMVLEDVSPRSLEQGYQPQF